MIEPTSGRVITDQAGGPADPSRDESLPDGAHPSRWRIIADDPPPHETLVLLYWMDWRNQGYMDVGYGSTGERYPNGYSTMSYHGDATHWMPLPEVPALDRNPLTGGLL